MLVHVVDNRAFLLGLDERYRSAMKEREKGELLDCARAVAQKLDVAPASVPVEGYYAEEQRLTEYFLLLRALQGQPLEREPEVTSLAGFQRLLAVTSSPVFGAPIRERKLLPKGMDPLSAALGEALTPADWSLVLLVPLAARKARERDDYSLVGLAAIAEDPVVLAALRESVALYAKDMLVMGMPPKARYEWRVDPELESRARRFVAAFNALMNASLPRPAAKNAAVFWNACDESTVVGRCVRLGQVVNGGPYYHWAIRQGPGDELAVHEFWDDSIWTTQRYRTRGGEEQYVPRWSKRMTTDDIP